MKEIYEMFTREDKSRICVNYIQKIGFTYLKVKLLYNYVGSHFLLYQIYELILFKELVSYI